MTGQPQILTIGHSTLEADEFIALLRQHGVTAVADVRSQPYSRYAPRFNRAELSASLGRNGIQYVFLGRELGARSTDPECYVHGRVQYGRLAETPAFSTGIARVLAGAQTERIALMCTEKDPLDCHRTVLVARRLEETGATVSHIRADGTTEPHADAMDRLMKQLRMEPSLFRTRDELVIDALAEQELRIAYVDAELASSSESTVS